MEKKEQKTSYDGYSDNRSQQKWEVIRTLTKAEPSGKFDQVLLLLISLCRKQNERLDGSVYTRII